jgi:hypothetical protein
VPSQESSSDYENSAPNSLRASLAPSDEDIAGFSSGSRSPNSDLSQEEFQNMSLEDLIQRDISSSQGSSDQDFGISPRSSSGTQGIGTFSGGGGFSHAGEPARFDSRVPLTRPVVGIYAGSGTIDVPPVTTRAPFQDYDSSSLPTGSYRSRQPSSQISLNRYIPLSTGNLSGFRAKRMLKNYDASQNYDELFADNELYPSQYIHHCVSSPSTRTSKSSKFVEGNRCYHIVPSSCDKELAGLRKQFSNNAEQIEFQGNAIYSYDL